MKKLFLLLLLLLIGAAGVGAWLFLGPATAFTSKTGALYIRSNAATKSAILDSVQKNQLFAHPSLFTWLATRMDLWNNLKAGKYEVKKGSSLFAFVRKLRNGQQSPVNLVITKLRTKEDLARLAARRFECDSVQMMAFLNSSDSLQAFGVEPELAMTLVLPDTYTFFWNTTPQQIYTKLANESKAYWTDARKAEADSLGLSFSKAYVLASIVEEETNDTDEKDTIASVYLNRIAKNMPLQADPTIKFGLRDFSLKRIYEKHWRVPTPYNTYLNRGLPPGPICTPSKTTLNAVLQAPKTDYVYFVADKSFNGTHVFTTNYTDHLRYAHQYQKALDSVLVARQAKADMQ